MSSQPQGATKEITVMSDGETHQFVDLGGPLLDSLLAFGFPIPYQCRNGECGECKVRLVSGNVDSLSHTDDALSDEEKEQGYILACRARPLTDTHLSYDD